VRIKHRSEEQEQVPQYTMIQRMEARARIKGPGPTVKGSDSR